MPELVLMRGAKQRLLISVCTAIAVTLLAREILQLDVDWILATAGAFAATASGRDR